jgi:hypothetical protein
VSVESGVQLRPRAATGTAFTLPGARLYPESWPVQIVRYSRPYSYEVAYNASIERLPNIPWPKVPEVQHKVGLVAKHIELHDTPIPDELRLVKHDTVPLRTCKDSTAQAV